jgi:hypothetical protein
MQEDQQQKEIREGGASLPEVLPLDSVGRTPRTLLLLSYQERIKKQNKKKKRGSTLERVEWRSCRMRRKEGNGWEWEPLNRPKTMGHHRAKPRDSLPYPQDRTGHGCVCVAKEYSVFS